ncbi:hypothetical protein DA102_035405 [Sinorhizobium meliloti]|nr:hypothetical protein DA102_035405 [Sinorhizobium meliloti]
MSAKQGSQVRRSTPANLSSAGAARDGVGFPDGFCFGVLFRRKAGGSFRSVRLEWHSEASFPAEKDRRTCRWRRHVGKHGHQARPTPPPGTRSIHCQQHLFDW